MRTRARRRRLLRYALARPPDHPTPTRLGSSRRRPFPCLCAWLICDPNGRIFPSEVCPPRYGREMPRGIRRFRPKPRSGAAKPAKSDMRRTQVTAVCYHPPACRPSAARRHHRRLQLVQYVHRQRDPSRCRQLLRLPCRQVPEVIPRQQPVRHRPENRDERAESQHRSIL